MVDHGALQTVGHVPQAQELANDIIAHLVKIGHLDNQIQEPNMRQNSRLRLVSTYMRQTDESTDRCAEIYSQTDLIEWYFLLYLNGMLHRAVNVVSKMLTHLLILRNIT